MKNLRVLLLCCIALSGCNKKQECAAPPPSITFKLQDVSGKDVSTLFANKVAVLYEDKGQVKSVNVDTSINNLGNDVSFFSFFPSLVGGGISDFTLKLSDGRLYPIQVALSAEKDACSRATIQRIQFDGKTVEPSQIVQPTTYLFTVK